MSVRMVEQPGEPALGSRETLTNKVLDNLENRLTQMHAQQPEALVLMAEMLAAFGFELRGVASIVCPPHLQATHFREYLRGIGGDPGFLTIARAVKSMRPEAGAAVDALLAILARERGKVLLAVDASGAPIAVGPAIGRVTQEVADIVRQFMEAGTEIDAAEFDLIEREYREAEDAMVRLRCAMHRARKGLR